MHPLELELGFTLHCSEDTLSTGTVTMLNESWVSSFNTRDALALAPGLFLDIPLSSRWHGLVANNKG